MTGGRRPLETHREGSSLTDTIGVAVIGAGMAGRSHAQGYRNAQTVFGTDAPAVRLVAIADINADFANHTKNRYGFERAEESWQAIVDADDIDAVSIVVANHLHREIAEALLASGKHVLCEKPLASRVQDAEAMAKAAAESGRVAACGFSYRRSLPPAPSANRSRTAHLARSCISTAAIGAIIRRTQTPQPAGVTKGPWDQVHSRISAATFST